MWGCKLQIIFLFCFNFFAKSFKSIQRECWEDVAKVVKDAGMRQTITLVLSSVLRLGGYVFLHESKLMIQRSFEVCGITTNPGLACNYDILKRIIDNVELDIGLINDYCLKGLFEN